jgi:hypothetical protein
VNAAERDAMRRAGAEDGRASRIAAGLEDREMLTGVLVKTARSGKVVLSGRCGVCGYMLPDSPGHVNTCGPTP